MKAKKILSLILAGAAAVSLLAGCGSDTENTQADTAQSDAQEDTAQDETQITGEDGSDTTASGNVLVVYYAEPYTDADLDWTDDNSRVSREYADESLRDVELVSTTVENWDSYDTVFIGYPIWWGIAAWPVDTFVEANDFAGKTVIPFCTSSSSGIGDSGELLADLAGTGDWQTGERFRSGADESDVQEWVNGLGL